MRPPWREILIGWLAERACATNPIYISRAQCEFIDRLMGGSYPLQDSEVASRLWGRSKKPGFTEYCRAVYEDFQNVVEGGEIEFKLTHEAALALLAMACNSTIYEEVTKSDDSD